MKPFLMMKVSTPGDYINELMLKRIHLACHE